MGGAMGAVLGGWLPAASPGYWALLAMAATMGGTMRAPLTATFFAVELTGNSNALLPLITACAAAHLVTVLLMKRSILTEKIARRGHHIVREYSVDPFVLTRVSEVMTREVQTVPASMTLQGAVRFLAAPERRHPSFPVVDADGHVLGIIDPPSVMRWRQAGKHRSATLGELLTGTRIIVADPDEYLESLVEKLMKANVAHLPVVTPDDGVLIGYVGWKDLMSARQKVRGEDRNRAAFLGLAINRSRKTNEE
jgi:CBS-domain-containing membrane protein